MTELHNMSVPPRTTFRVRRERLVGRRFRVNLRTSIPGATPESNETIARRIRNDNGAYLLKLIEGRDSHRRRGARHGDASAQLRAVCETALALLSLPAGLGFFVDEPDAPGDVAVPAAAAVAILAARSGPLYLPGRFEPSLISLKPVTLFFPHTGRDSRDAEEDPR